MNYTIKKYFCNLGDKEYKVIPKMELENPKEQ